MKFSFLTVLSLFLFQIGLSQNTVGILSNTADAFNGYMLLTPVRTAGTTSSSYLVDNCGRIVNTWTSDYPIGFTDFLLEDGSLMKVVQNNISTNLGLLPGVGGRIEHRDWDNNIIWEYDFCGDGFCHHHDFYPLPNGNILILVAYNRTEAEAIQAGRDPSTLASGALFEERIIELQPVGTNGANVVWEWSSWDHMVQDFDNSKDNFGVVGDNVGKIDINYVGTSLDNANWLQLNALDYNADLDQILISARQLSEIYVIDHNTTTAEAAGAAGDIMYRWGNPEAYDHGTAADKKLFGQHSPNWIENGLPDAGKILVFNNGLQRPTLFSTVDIIDTPVNMDGTYMYTTGVPYGPTSETNVYTASTPTDFYATFLSNAQRLPNGNTLINNGPIGNFFEIDASQNVVWNYMNPVYADGILAQGDDPSTQNTRRFRVKKYAPDYPAFDGRVLIPGNTIETGASMMTCNILSVPEDTLANNLNIYPNPVSSILHIESNLPIASIELYAINGQRLLVPDQNSIDLSFLSKGVYILKIETANNSYIKKIIKE